MNKKILKKVGYSFIGIAIILFGIQYIMDYKWEKENKLLLERALQTGNAEYCNEYNYKFKCVVLVGTQKKDANICDNNYSEEPTLTACKAAVLDDKNLCKNFDRPFIQQTCESM